MNKGVFRVVREVNAGVVADFFQSYNLSQSSSPLAHALRKCGKVALNPLHMSLTVRNDLTYLHIYINL